MDSFSKLPAFCKHDNTNTVNASTNKKIIVMKTANFKNFFSMKKVDKTVNSVGLLSSNPLFPGVELLSSHHYDNYL